MRNTVYNITENCLLYTVYSCFCLGQHTTNHRATYFRDGKTNRNETPVIISVAIETSWFCLLIASVASYASVPTGEWRALLGGSAHVRCHCEMAFLYFLQIVPWQRTWIVVKHVWVFSKTKHLTSLHSAPHNVNTCVWMRRCITPLCRVSCDMYSEWWFKMLRLCTYCMIYAVLSILRRLHLSLPSFLDVSHLDTWRSAQRRRSGCKRLGRLKHQFEFLWNSWTMVGDVKHGPIWSLRRSWLLTLDPGASQVKWSSLCRFQQSIQSCGNWCRAASWHVLT